MLLFGIGTKAILSWDSRTKQIRMVNVLVTPFGRCGAPEAEPEPTGVGRLAEDDFLAAADCPGIRLTALTAADAAGTSRRVGMARRIYYSSQE